MAVLKEIATIPRVLGLIVVPAVSLAIDKAFGVEILTAFLLTVYVAVLFAFLIDHHRVPTAYLKLRKLHAEAKKKAASHPVLLRRYQDSISTTKTDLEEIISENFEFDVSDVPETSIFAMDTVDNICYLTFPLDQSEDFLIPRTGMNGRYYESMVEASRRIGGSSSGGVTRIFIIKRQDEINESLITFMNANQNDGINVRVIFEDKLPPQPESVEFIDFGCYETKGGHSWVMALGKHSDGRPGLRYIVDTSSTVYRDYKSYCDDIIRVSMDLSAFEDEILIPMNGKLWPIYFAEKKFEMLPPHGLSIDDADYICDSLQSRILNPSESNVLVLGFTPKLFDSLKQRKIGKITSIDQSKTRPSVKGVSFITENWLKMREDRVYDGICFDESINNLTHLQVGIFFSNLAKALKPGGLLIGRAMGRFDSEKTSPYQKMSQGRIIEALRKMEAKSHEDVASLIICLAHSANVSFSVGASLLDCGLWNGVMAKLKSDRLISQTEYEMWKLPFEFKLLSPDQSFIMREAGSSGLNLIEMRKVQGGYTEKWADTESFYRILSFEGGEGC
jgi:hypothetical protein